MSNIIYPIYKCFNDQIFSGKKPFEFRTKLPNELSIGSKVYIYEPAKHGGSKMVVGEFTVGEIFDCNYFLGCIPFMVYFCRNVLKNEDYAKKFERTFVIDLPEYKKGTAMNFAFDDDAVEYMEKYHKYPKISYFSYDDNRRKSRWENQMAMEKCDRWLREIGFYNECDESYYNYSITIVNPIRYETPKPLSDFIKKDGTPVASAPQGFVYVTN